MYQVHKTLSIDSMINEYKVLKKSILVTIKNKIHSILYYSYIDKIEINDF